MPSSQNRDPYRYIYDPLDRLSSCGNAPTVMAQRFHNINRLSTLVQGALKESVFQTKDYLLAQQRSYLTDDTVLLVTDSPRTVLNPSYVRSDKSVAYCPYGYRAPAGGKYVLLGFNGECADPVTGHYLLGNGHRAFNPVLMRFNSPDNLSPFGEGGINAYGYCGGDPINRTDEDGHAWRFWGALRKRWSAMFKTAEPLPSHRSLNSSEGTQVWRAATENYDRIGAKRKILKHKAKDESLFLKQRNKASSASKALLPEWKEARKNVMLTVNTESPFMTGPAVVSSSKSLYKVGFNDVVSVQAFYSREYIGAGLDGKLITVAEKSISVRRFELNLSAVKEKIRQFE